MRSRNSGREKGHGGRTTPHGIGQRGPPPGPKDLEQRAEPESGARRDPLPREYQTHEPDDVPGVTKKIGK